MVIIIRFNFDCTPPSQTRATNLQYVFHFFWQMAILELKLHRDTLRNHPIYGLQGVLPSWIIRICAGGFGAKLPKLLERVLLKPIKIEAWCSAQISNLLCDEKCSEAGDNALHERVDVKMNKVFACLEILHLPEILKR